MRNRTHHWLTAVALIVVTLGAAGPVVADGEATGIVVTPPRVKAGDEIVIQGFALWTELELDATLIGRGGAARPLGPGATGPDGTLYMTTKLPADVPAGQYTVRVTNIHGETAEAPLVVEAEFPIVPVAAVLGAVLVAGLVAFSAMRRRSGRALD